MSRSMLMQFTTERTAAGKDVMCEEVKGALINADAVYDRTSTAANIDRG